MKPIAACWRSWPRARDCRAPSFCGADCAGWQTRCSPSGRRAGPSIGWSARWATTPRSRQTWRRVTTSTSTAASAPLNARVLIDTGALLALANPRDQYHERALATGRRFLESGGRWVGTALVLAEFHGHVLHRRGPAAARAVVSALLDDPVYHCRDWLMAMIGAVTAARLETFRTTHFLLTAAVL